MSPHTPTREITHLAFNTTILRQMNQIRCILYVHSRIPFPTSRVVDTSSNPQSVEHDQESSLPTSVFALLGSPSTTQDTTCPLGFTPKLLTVSWSCGPSLQTCGNVPEWSWEDGQACSRLGTCSPVDHCLRSWSSQA
jgi:hypothetical protein